MNGRGVRSGLTLARTFAAPLLPVAPASLRLGVFRPVLGRLGVFGPVLGRLLACEVVAWPGFAAALPARPPNLVPFRLGGLLARRRRRRGNRNVDAIGGSNGRE